jgi:hypothetical protein
VWTEIDLAPYQPAVPIDLAFRGRQLVVALSSGKLLAWNGKRLWEWRTVSTDQRHMREAGSDLLVLGGNDGMLHFFNDELAGDLHLPTPLQGLRLAARPGASRVVAVGEGMIAGFDLADSLPALAPGTSDTPVDFVDDDTLLIWPQWSSAWQWYDVRTQAATPLSYSARGMPQVIDADPDDGRVLVLDSAQDSSLALLRKNTADVKRLARGPIVTARLLAHDVVVVATETRLFTVAGSQPPRELVKLDGSTRGVVRIGATGFAALSERGELVRGDVGTGALARTRVAAGTSWGLTGDRAGRVVIALGDRLWLWDPTRIGGGARTAGSAAADGSASAALVVTGSGAAPGSSAPAGDPGPVEIARLPQDAIWLAPCDAGVLVGLADHSVALSSLVPGAPVTRLLPPASRPPQVSRDGSLIVGESVNKRLAVVETATGARWELPGHASPHDLQRVSPTARRFAQSGPRTLALWTLPLAPLELRRWLDLRTNAATDGGDVLTWVWQPTPP